MSIHHPFSASSKPLPNTDTEYWNRKTPLPFAATLNQGPLFGETQEEVIPGPSHRSPLKRKEGQGRQRRHRRSESNGSDTTCDSLSPTLTDRSLPSDDELKDKDLDPFRLSEQRIAECVFSDTPRLDLTGFGLDRLSDKVSDLRYISRLERKSVSLSDPSIGLKNLQSLGIGTPNSHSQKPFLRSASLPSPYLSQSTPNSPPPKSYSNPLGLGPPPSPQTRTLGTGGFYPPGSPVLEEGRVRKVPVGRNLTDGFGGRMRVRFGLAAGLRGELPPGSDREVREGEGESEDPFLVPRREGPARVGLGTPFLPSKSYGALPSSTITPSPSTTTTTASPSRTGTRSMTRTPSGFYTSQESPWVGKGAGDLELWLSRNRLDRLPSGLWLLTNLTVLSLRDNQLDRLPAGIGQLERLTELNVSNNLITSFPPALLDLKALMIFHCINNPLVKGPYETCPSGRLLGPLQTHDDNANPTHVPSLYNTCTTLLLSTSEPDQLPLLLSKFDWNPESGDPHALQSPLALQAQMKCFSLRDCTRIIQVLRSALDVKRARAYEQGVPVGNGRDRDRDGRKMKGAIGLEERKKSTRTREDRGDSVQDDSASNPLFSPCPNPSHYHYHHSQSQSQSPAHMKKISKWIYLHKPIESRIEYVDLAGEKKVPIKWDGCGRGCLDFLMTEPPGGMSDDGFDPAVLQDGEDTPWGIEM